MELRRASLADFDGIWEIFRSVVATGGTYVFAPGTPRDVDPEPPVGRAEP